jgi:hypothetical protein
MTSKWVRIVAAQLRSFGVEDGAAGTEEDWHAGSRKTVS